jgi:hypothetical protein
MTLCVPHLPTADSGLSRGKTRCRSEGSKNLPLGHPNLTIEIAISPFVSVVYNAILVSPTGEIWNTVFAQLESFNSLRDMSLAA